MSKPTRGDRHRLKRLGRYLLGRPSIQQIYHWQDTRPILKVFADAGRAGGRETRKPTTGGRVMLGSHALKDWSKTRALIVLCPGGSEFYVALKASAEALGLVALLQDFGYNVNGEIWGDAGAALGVVNRKCLGNTWHIGMGLLWIQQMVAYQRLRYANVLGKENLADLSTKFLDGAVSNVHIKKLEPNFTQGWSSEAPPIARDKSIHGRVQAWDPLREFRLGTIINKWPKQSQEQKTAPNKELMIKQNHCMYSDKM